MGNHSSGGVDAGYESMEMLSYLLLMLQYPRLGRAMKEEHGGTQTYPGTYLAAAPERTSSRALGSPLRSNPHIC